MPLISATIVAHNEANTIARAIHSLSCADEVIVVDSGSTDDTVEVARKCGARILYRAWEGFAAQKNFATSQAQYDWILSLDADEELNEAAQAAVLGWKAGTPAAA